MKVSYSPNSLDKEAPLVKILILANQDAKKCDDRKQVRQHTHNPRGET